MTESSSDAPNYSDFGDDFDYTMSTAPLAQEQPQPDNDNDEILDADDKCPLEPEDLDGVADDDGCPDGDKDGDGTSDKKENQ